MKLNDLKQKRTDLVLRYNEIMQNDELSDELRSEAQEIGVKLPKVEADIILAERSELLAQKEAERAESVEVPEETEERMSLLKGVQTFFRTGVAPDEFRGENGGFLLPFEFRTDLTLTQLGTDNKNKTVDNSLSIAQTPAEMLLANLGVTKYTGLTGDFVLPNMPQVNAGFVAETVAVPDASADPGDLKLVARRLGAYNVVTKEVLSNSQPAIWNGIINDIRAAWYRAQVADLFDQIQTDAVDASTTIAGSTLAYADFVDLQANVPFDMVRPVYITTPAVAAFAKKTATIASVNGPIWDGAVMNGSVDGIAAYGTSLANADHLIYMDAAAAVVAEWGPGLELLLNPYEFDVEGKVKVTISGLTDTGFRNYRFASWIADVSI